MPNVLEPKRGKQPVWRSTVMRDYIHPQLESWDQQEDVLVYISPHVFYVAQGQRENVKVVQELLRHSTAKTLDTYTYSP